MKLALAGAAFAAALLAGNAAGEWMEGRFGAMGSVSVWLGILACVVLGLRGKR
jgi:hypothetical protein